MEWYEVELDRKRTKALAGARWGLVPEQEQQEPVDYLGGIIHDNEWGWVTSRYASEATLLVHRLATGERVARHTFWRESGSSKDEDERCSISCVEEVFTDQPDRPVLFAVCLESWNGGGQRRPKIDQIRSQVHLYSVTYYQVLRILDLDGLLCRSLAYLDQRLCSATQLALFDGCLAVATLEGLVLLIDLNYEQLLANKSEVGYYKPAGTKPGQSELHRIPGNKYLRGIKDLLQKCRTDGVHLTVELDVARVGIRCLVGLGLAPGFAAGLDDGHILIYDLINFQLTVALRASKKPDELGPVERLCAIVPPDDPKPCFYICAMYKAPDRLSMVLHSVNYSSVKHVRDGFHFQNFYASSVRNQQCLDIGDCSVTGCSTVSTFSFAGDNGTLLAILSWRSHTDRKNKLVLFDMNQWYKDEMPEGVQGYEKPHYLAGYILKGLPSGLALLLRPTSILHFVALQRYEEHFYPNSLTFDCELLTPNSCQYYAHDGVQRRFLEALRKDGATLFLRPQSYHADIVRLRLLPQFCELNVDATFSKSAMYDVILSVALEHGCTALLDDCASSWLDGSFLCNMLDPTELSLATLTNWIVRRAGHIKKRISEICQGVFDYGGYSLDERERREFEALSEQMCELVRLQSHILKLGKRSLTFDQVEKLEENERALQTVNEYQKVLYWFIKQGLLPEGQNETHNEAEQQQQQQQPLVALRRSYAERRSQRRRLYIDTLTKETGLGENYPPDTLQALLHVMLDPDTDLVRKHKLILYMLYDLDQELAKRFPLAFRMEEPNVRSVSCFWWLDRGGYKKCIAEIYDNRMNSPRGFATWEMHLLVETLLQADDVKAAMRVVSQPPGPVTNTLYMDVLLANNCIPEAFHKARLALDEKGKPLVERFFRRCIENRRYKVLAELCLTDEEEQMVYRLLQECPSAETEQVQLILLLLKSKYIEATNFMDDVAVRRQRANDDASMSILSAYRATMAPVTQNIAGNYFRIRGKLDEDLANGPNAEHRLPLSAQLARQRARGQLGDIFQSCAISALWAENRPLPDDSPPFSMRINGNIPFLRTERYGFSNPPQTLRVVRPVPHKIVEKRQREREERDREVPASIMQPRKRRCLQAEQVIENIRDRMNSLLGQQSSDLERSQEQVKASDLVQPPTFLQPRKHFHTPTSNSPVKIPTILKRRTVAEAMVSGTPPTATSTSLSQPKCFRFQPPIPLRLDSSLSMERSPEDAADENEVPEEAEEEEEETDEIIMEIESRSEPRSAYSVESEEEEEEVFLSPLTTATVPRVNRLSGSAEATKLTPTVMAPPAGPQPRGSLLQGRASGSITGSVTGSVIGSGGSSSGFGSFATVQPAQTTSHSQFVPTVCSSKMYETQSQVFSTGSTMAKISERTTICGDMESTDLVASMAVTASSQWSMPAARLSGQTMRMLDTTLDMSTYDATSLEQRTGLDQDQEQEEDITELVLEESQEEDEQGNQYQAQSHVPGTSELSSPEMRHQREEKVSSNNEDSDDDMLPKPCSWQGVQEPMSESESEISTRRSPTCSEGVVELVSSDDEESENKAMQCVGGIEDREEEQEDREEEQDDREEEQDDREEEQDDREEKHFEPQSAVEITERSEPGYQQMTYFSAGQQATVQAPLPSPTGSSRSSTSELSSPEMRQQVQEVELVSSNDEESTGSITTSRSVTHTPEGTTFLPSDTNVSQTSSPRAPHNPGGDGSPRSLYRANSLETVDDLDTTKGSLEEEEEDDEDDCVIALDGTEVRGYVARPQQATACSSAELFAFKDECADEATPKPCPSLSLGATVNSDSVVAADIIELDSDEENEEQEAQEQDQEIQEQEEEIQEIDDPKTGQDEGLKVDAESKSDSEIEHKEQPEEEALEEEASEEEASEEEASKEQAPEEPKSSINQDENSRQSLKLAFSEDEADEEVAAVTAAVLTPRRSLRPRRNSAEPHQDSPIVRRARLRSDDSGGTPPVVATPKRRAPKHKVLLEVIDEQVSLNTSPLPLTRSRSRLNTLETVDAETPTRRLANSRRATSLAPNSGGASVESPRPRRFTRGISEPPDTPKRSLRGFSKSPTQTPPPRMATVASKPPVRTIRTRSRKNSSNDVSPAVSPTPSESEMPRLRRTTRRKNSEVSETGSTTSISQTRELRSSHRRPVSAEPEARPPSRSSQKASRTPTPTEASSEAHVPLKKRGRSKK